jgi:uncharacterized membrane protein YdcZ (DUF606 family)
MGKLYLNTAAQLKHYHDASGDLISINMAEWWYVMGGMFGALRTLFHI